MNTPEKGTLMVVGLQSRSSLNPITNPFVLLIRPIPKSQHNLPFLAPGKKTMVSHNGQQDCRFIP
jgi:hypothetical protein